MMILHFQFHGYFGRKDEDSRTLTSICGLQEKTFLLEFVFYLMTVFFFLNKSIYNLKRRLAPLRLKLIGTRDLTTGYKRC